MCISEELQKKAKFIFGLLGLGCIGIIVYGAIASEGAKNWRGDRLAEKQASQAAFQARQDATQRVQVKPKPVAPAPTSPGAVRNQQSTPSGEASPYQPLVTTPSNTQSDYNTNLMMNSLAETILRESRMYFQEHRTYQGFAVSDQGIGCISAVVRVSPAGDAISAVLMGDCREGQGKLYGCTDSISQSLVALSEQEYAASLSQYGRCVGWSRGESASSGASGKDIPEGQPGVSGGFVPGAQSQ